MFTPAGTPPFSSSMIFAFVTFFRLKRKMHFLLRKYIAANTIAT